MQSFKEYVQYQTLPSKIRELASLIAESEMDADGFIKAWYVENEPDIAMHLIEAGFWQGVKDAGQQMWQGMKQGGQAFARSTFGPEARMDSAVKSLSGLVQYLGSDPNLKSWTGSQPGSNLINQVNGMVKQLNQLKPHLPQNQVQPAANNWNRQQQPQQNQQNQPQQPQMQLHQPANPPVNPGMVQPAMVGRP